MGVALLFAGSGESVTAGETLREQRKILLALTGERADVNAFRYALNMCKRIGAGLEILYVSEQPSKTLELFQSELNKEGVEYRLIKGSGCIREEVLEYTEKNKGILFVVVESSEGLDINCRRPNRRLKESWERLKCPLVVVSELGHDQKRYLDIKMFGGN